ncbi:hypothetical protein OMCYN_00471 [cyanobiont of Ornithocercus magnificus]|nr:hypothetical protein OMCYN_00471 [cyanobiont of Ornithocercus magnificus]
MTLAFHASQHLDLSIDRETDRLPSYLQNRKQVLSALLGTSQLECLGYNRFRYVVAALQVFHLSIRPVVVLDVGGGEDNLTIHAVDVKIEGMGLVDDSDFQLTLNAILRARKDGLTGQADLGVQVGQLPLLRFIPKHILEKTGESVLNGLLLTIKGRVGQQVLKDFLSWCDKYPISLQNLPEK